MPRTATKRAALTFGLAALLGTAAADPPKHAPSDEHPLAMSPAIACRSIDGYQQYEILPGAELTADEKLLVYYRPQNYAVEESGGKYHIHLVQDGRIRPRGKKTVLRRKDTMFEYKLESDTPPTPIYMKTAVSLKGLKPGEYEFDIVLHDKLGPSATATQSIPFRVIEAVVPQSGAEPEAR